MTRQLKRRLWIIRLGIGLAASLVLFLGGPATARSSGENDVGKVAPVAAAPTRTSTVKRSRQQMEEDRAMVSAMAGKRDPFKIPPPPQIRAGGDTIDGPLPPGARGLVIGLLRLKGIVRDEESKTMIAVVVNRANLAYFLHIHEDVYNGVVSRITPDAIYFQQKGLDTGGRSGAREVVLRMGPERQEAR
jgi:hypothetical protein